MRGGGVRRGNATICVKRGVRGDSTERGMLRGAGVMRGRVSSRWEVAA
jgi:hypothetical protein